MDRRCFADAINSVEMGDSLDESRRPHNTQVCIYEGGWDTVCMLPEQRAQLRGGYSIHRDRPCVVCATDLLPLHKPKCLSAALRLPSACNNYTSQLVVKVNEPQVTLSPVSHPPVSLFAVPFHGSGAP